MDTAAAAVWADPDTPALCLVALGLDRFLPRDPRGTVADGDGSPINWTPQTWAAEIEAECGVRVGHDVAHRLAAGLALLHSPDEFYHTAPGFHTVAEALVSDRFDTTSTHPLSAAETAWAVIQAYTISPPKSGGGFSRVVSGLVHRICRADGYATVPPALITFGIAADPKLAPPTPADEPAAAEAVAGSQADLVAAFEAWIKARLLDLADRVENLPLRHSDPKPVAADLRRLSGG